MVTPTQFPLNLNTSGPPTQSPQSVAISTANDYMDIASELLAMYRKLKELNAVAVDNNVATILGKLQTVSVGQDGALATVNDANITATNPMNPVLYPAFNRPVSLTQLVALKTVLDGIINYVEGQAVTTQPTARVALHAVVGG